MLNDEWTLNDKLGYKLIVDNIINTVENINPPFTLGIYGGWGSGKTSIMKQVFYKIGGKSKSYLFPFDTTPEKEDISEENQQIIDGLSDTKNYEAIWFNPWKHELEANPLLGLLHEIREHFNLYNKIEDEAKKLSNVTIRAGLDILTNAIKEITKIDLSPSNIEKYGTKYEKDNFEIKSATQNFRLVFESAIKKLLSSSDTKKLIIFIDDLDRCTDAKIIKLLEGIKLYLSTSNCIFIFGMDKNNVINALKNNQINEEYLDKLFQSVVRIPISTKYTDFITSTIIENYFNEYLRNDDKKKSFAKLITDIEEKNPRKIKNFANSLKFYWDMSNDNSLDLEIFTLFHYLRIHYEPIFEIIERDTEHFKELINICLDEAPSTKVGSFFKYILNNPLLNSIDDNSEDENSIVNSELLESDEVELMHKTKVKFKAISNFKDEFSEKCKDLEEEDIKKYLGVIHV